MFATIDQQEEEMTKICGSIDEYSQFVTLKSYFEVHVPDIKYQLEMIRVAICKKFKIMVLVDLGGTIFFRTDKKDVNAPAHFKLKRHEYFLRPGFKEFIRKLVDHPRSTFCFYTSIMRKNVLPILFAVLDSKYDLEDVRAKIGIFDQE